MRKHLLSIVLSLVIVPIFVCAQTPFDAFSPETSRIILDGDSIAAWRAEQQNQLSHHRPKRAHADTILCALIADLRNEQLLLVDIASHRPVAAAPFTDEIKNWLSVDPLVDKNITTSPYLYCNGNPIMFIDPDGRSTKTSEDGQVQEVQDDGDLGVYRWNPSTSQYELMGESLHAYSFADQSEYNKSGTVVADKRLRIDFGSNEFHDKIESALTSDMTIVDYMKEAGSGGIYDFKAHTNVGSLIAGKYASPRDAGNVLAGAFKASKGPVAPFIQYGYGAYNLSGNNKNAMFNLIMTNFNVSGLSPVIGGVMAAYIMFGEDKLSQICIDLGFGLYWSAQFPACW